MKGKKILYVSSEVIPYMPQTDIANMTYSLPKMVNENGGQTRIFIPKYGIINERRHQLHEVIRLSGINLIIDDMDMPLILKVASIPKERMQVYFIDSEDYFKNRLVEFQNTAENIKINVGSALTELEDPPPNYPVHGRDLMSGIPKETILKRQKEKS